jgi:hypothetical protein
MSADQNRRRTLASLAAMAGLIGAGVATADEEATPDLEFLEYLGSWEADEEDWVLLAPDATPDEASNEADKESVETPDGDQLAELNDES